MRTAATSRESFAFAAIAVEAALSAVDLRLRSGDERRQPINAAIVRNRRLLRLLILRRVALLALMFARLVLLARLVRLLMVPLIIVAGRERLLLLRHRDKSRLLAEI